MADRKIICAKLGHEAEGLDFAPWPGELGQRIYLNVSKQAWSDWLKHQTMLINEYRISPFDQKSRAFLAAEMEKFLFGGAAEKPPGYQPQD